MTRVQRGQVAWLSIRLQLAYAEFTRTLFDGDLVSCLLLPAILDANVGHLDADPLISRHHQGLNATYPDELRRPANALSIASFLDIPRETVRVRLAGMVADGVLHRTEGGYILPTAIQTSERFLPMVPRYLEALNDFLSGLGMIRAFGLEPGSGLAHPVWPVAWAALRLSTAHVLRQTGYARELTAGMSVTGCYMLLHVCQAVSGQLRVSPQMPAGGGALAPLEPCFGPVRGSAIATRLGLPEETVRRHLKQLVAAGYLRRVSGGYDVEHNTMTLPIWRAFQKRTMGNGRQLIWRLTTTGIVPPVG